MNDALQLLKYYLAENKNPTSNQLINMSKEIGVSGIAIYSGKTGKQEVTSEDISDPRKKKAFKAHSELNVPWMLKLKDADGSIRIGRFSNAKNVERPRKTATIWSKKSDAFIRVRYDEEGLRNALLTNMPYSNINYISLFAPSGKTILTTSESLWKESKEYAIKNQEYVQSPIVSISSNELLVSFSFGESAFFDSAYTNGLVKNQGDPYFYNIAIGFSVKELQKQLMMIIGGFFISTLFVYIAIYYINAYVDKTVDYAAQANQLSQLSERTSDKVIQLCNARLGEVRRYVTKIVKDSMHLDNMNKELPKEMVQLLDKAFREVDEKDFSATKIESDKD